MEKKIQIRVIAKLLVAVLFASLYALGGMEGGGGLWLRRFLAPTILCLSAFGFSKDWRYLLQMPFMFFSLSLPYGAVEVWKKILLRFSFGAANGITSSIRNIIWKKWLLVGWQLVLLTSGYVIFGVWNPLPSARAEEILLGMFIGLIVMLSCPDYKDSEES